ncbi:MAG: type II secretion system protein [Candidatus Rokubacteria bacterium]|nr:type II secretion system protein [Candidatus Rokubacteria bacterium]
MSYKASVRAGTGRPARESGATAVEMLIVVSVMTFLAAATLPLVGTAIAEMKALTATQQVLSGLRAARQSAIAAAATYTVTLNATTIAIACTANCPATRPPDSTDPIVNGATLTWTANPLTFTSTGAGTQGAVTVSYPGAADSIVGVNVPGRIAICPPKKKKSKTCP